MVKKFFYAVSAALLIAAMSSCGNGEQKKENNTQEPATQPTEQTTQEAKPADNAQAAPKDTNKKYMCVACNDYFDNPGDCPTCGMELVENVDYKAE